MEVHGVEIGIGDKNTKLQTEYRSYNAIKLKGYKL